MKRFFPLALAALLMAVLPVTVKATSITQHGLEVTDPYAFATAPSQKNGAIFLSIKNNTHALQKITSAETSVAERVELHTHISEDGKMRMREVENFTLPANETVVLKPHGDHIMLFGLKKPLEEGERFSVTLNFDARKPMTFDVEVVSPGYNPADDLDQTNDESAPHEHSHH
jgi:copper(I)-binding protein